MKQNPLLFPTTILLIFLFSSSAYAADVESQDPATVASPEEDHEPILHLDPYETNIAILVASFTTVFIGGLGDKTFLIAAFMSMKFKPVLIFIGAAVALFIILSFSAAFGAIVPDLIPANYVHIAIIALFFLFGLKFLYEAYTFEDKIMIEEQIEVDKKIVEVESKLNHSFEGHREDNQQPLVQIELHNLDVQEKAVSEELPTPQLKPHHSHTAFAINRAVVLQAFSLIFFAEWGDRSQIYTIALASQHNPFIVFIGAFMGHIVCIMIAIIGGRYFAEHLSERTILALAGILYIMLGIFSIVD